MDEAAQEDHCKEATPNTHANRSATAGEQDDRTVEEHNGHGIATDLSKETAGNLGQRAKEYLFCIEPAKEEKEGQKEEDNTKNLSMILILIHNLLLIGLVLGLNGRLGRLRALYGFSRGLLSLRGGGLPCRSFGILTGRQFPGILFGICHRNLHYPFRIEIINAMAAASMQ
jgi:hypothetical protein